MQPLSVELGPGLLTTIFDGIQRPLKAIALSSGDCFIPRGVDVPALDRKKQWEFNPHKVKVLLHTPVCIMSLQACKQSVQTVWVQLHLERTDKGTTHRNYLFEPIGLCAPALQS